MKKQCIVLDLDETIIHTFSEGAELLKRIYKEPDYIKVRKRIYSFFLVDVMNNKGEGNASYHWGLMRNRAKAFLEYCFERFHRVVIWSAGRKEYVECVVEAIFRDCSNKPHYVYTWDDISDKNGDYYKDLSKICKDGITLENTFFVDDRSVNFIKNKANGIVIPPYEPRCNEEEILLKDDYLIRLVEWLESDEVINSEDVRKLDKYYIFRYPASYDPLKE